ncbi:MAG TPA: VCBS repeat-containing protein [Planctomycetota bacterium]|jgi:hypothetical protein|nr:VCBS repeat-containing protein [Planctomycetota bacterium]
MRRSALSTLVAGAGATALLAAAAPAQVWVQFTDQTASRLSAAPGVGTADPQEKDVAVGDIDNDGDTDLIVVRKFPFTVAGPMPNVLYINDNGVMTDMTATYAPDFLAASDSRAVEIVDLDGNGWKDVVVANTFGDPPDVLMNWGNNASGVWTGIVLENWRFPAVGYNKFCGLGVGDFSGDGMPDLYFVDYTNTLEDRIWLNNGSGVFTDITTTNLFSGYADSGFGTAGWIADMDNDGWADLVRGQAGSIQIFWNDGTGAFPGTIPFTAPVSSSGYDVGVGDLDNDGDLDMYYCQDPQDQYKRNPGGTAARVGANWLSHMFSDVESPNTNGFNANPHFADVDGDGDLDVGVSDVDVDVPGFSRRFSLLRNNFPVTSPTLLSNPYGAAQQNYNVFGVYDHAFLDVNGDGWLDLWISYGGGGSPYTGGTKIFIQTPQARLTEIGVGCAGSNGVPQIGTNGPPEIGNALFSVELSSALPGAIAVHFLCLGQTSVPFGPCTVYADLFSTLAASGAVVTNALGLGQVTLPVPNSTAIIGATLYEQWAVLDPAGPIPIAGGVALSAGLKIEVGL